MEEGHFECWDVRLMVMVKFNVSWRDLMAWEVEGVSRDEKL